MGYYAFLILSTVAALYAAYLLAFRTYHTDYNDRPLKGKPYRFTHFLYILLLVVCFVPLLNAAFVIVFFIIASCGRDEFYVDAWLFEKPGEKEEEE